MSEASVSRNRSTIIVPAGNSPDEGWAAFRNILAEIHEASGLFMMPNQVSFEYFFFFWFKPLTKLSVSLVSLSLRLETETF